MIVFFSKPDVSYSRVFGSTAYQHVPKVLRNKLAAKSEKVSFAGYTGRGKSYGLSHPGTKKISVSSDVQIFETNIHDPPATSKLLTMEGGYVSVNVPLPGENIVPVLPVVPFPASMSASISAPNFAMNQLMTILTIM